MLKKEQKKLNCISDKTENELLCLGYSRYVSRGHTLLSLFFEGITAIIFGTIGIVLSLVQIDYIPNFNKYYFLKTIQIVSFICLVYGGVIFVMWIDTKQKRNCIVRKIKELNAC